MDGEVPPQIHNTNSTHVMLTEFPVYGEFVNPGIGLQMYDFLVPLHGNERFNLVKETAKDPGSLSVPSNTKNAVKNDSQIVASLKQEGFGDIKNDTNDGALLEEINQSSVSELNNETKLKKLGPIFDAMKKAKVQTSEFQFKPKKNKAKGLKKIKTNSFHLV